MSRTKLIHPEYWQQASSLAPSQEHTVNSDYIEHDSNLVKLLFGVDSLTVSMINQISSLKTTPNDELANHLETFLQQNKLPIFTDLDVYNIFHDVIRLSAKGVQLVDAGGLQNTLVKKQGEKYKPIIIDLDPHLKSLANNYQLLFSDNYQERILCTKNSAEEKSNPLIKLVNDYSLRFNQTDFTKLRNLAAGLDFMLTKMPMFEMSRGQELRDHIINQVDQKLNPDLRKHIVNLRLQNEIQLRRVVRRSLENNCFSRDLLKSAIAYLSDLNKISNHITERGSSVLNSLKDI